MFLTHAVPRSGQRATIGIFLAILVAPGDACSDIDARSEVVAVLRAAKEARDSISRIAMHVSWTPNAQPPHDIVILRDGARYDIRITYPQTDRQWPDARD